MKNLLLIFCCFFLNTMYSQTDMGTLQGEVRDKSGPVIGVAIQIKGVGLDTMVGANLEGTYELQLKAGQYQIRTVYAGYEDTEATVTIKPNEVYKHISELELIDYSTPFKTPGEAIDDLYGNWTVTCITIDSKKYRQQKRIGQPTISFGKLEGHQAGLGTVSYRDSCKKNGNYWFEHIGNGQIKIAHRIVPIITPKKCKKNLALIKAIEKMPDNFEVQFTENDELLMKNDGVEMRLIRK